MARTRKSIQPLNLYKYDVLIEDKGTRSDYFRVTQFDGYFYGGRNAFLIAGTSILKPNSKILVEVLNANNETIFSAPIANFIEGSSRLVQVEIYSDTPPGPAKLVVLGSANKYLDGKPIPADWQDKYNVRWITDVIISPRVNNKTPIRFINTPAINVEEKFYPIPVTASFSQSVVVPNGNYEFTPLYYNTVQNGYLISLKNPNVNTVFSSDYINGELQTQIVINGSTEIISASLPITKIFNNTLAESRGRLITSSLGTVVTKMFVSGIGTSYSTSIEPLGTIGISSSTNVIRYNKLIEFTDTTSNTSFAKLRVSNLNTISGEINKVKISYKGTTDPGDFIGLSDSLTRVEELLSIDSGSKIVNLGQFNKINVATYWYAATMSLQKNDVEAIPPSYYFSSIPGNLALTQSSDDLLDSISTLPEIQNSTYKDNVSYFIGTTNTNQLSLLPNSEYTLKFNALFSTVSGSTRLQQSENSVEVYLIENISSPGELLEINPRGQLLGTLSAINSTQLFENVQLNFKPKINTAGIFGLRFIVYGGFWNFSEVSVKVAEEAFFSPDEVTLLVPNIDFSQKLLTFKTEYLDINNNSTNVSTVSLPVYFTGSQLQGVGGGTGTVTSITAGNGLSGGTINISGTISINTSSVHFLDGVKKELNTEGVISSSLQINTGSFSGSFRGDGSQLTGVVASGVGVSIADDGVIQGNAGRLDFGNFITATVASNTASIAVTLPAGTVSSSAQINTGSFSGSFTGNFIGTSSWASNSTSASFASTASYFSGSLEFANGLIVTGSITASVGFTGSFFGSLIGTSSWAASASRAITASNADLLDGLDSTIFATTGSNRFVGNQIITGSLILSSSLPLELQVIGDTEITGSLRMLGGITSSLFGTSSWANSASFSISSSFATSTSFAVSSSRSVTSSFSISSSVALSSSFATSASFAVSSSVTSTASALLGGTTNYIPLWSSATTLSSSAIFQSAGNIGIGTTNPQTTLHIYTFTSDGTTTGRTTPLNVLTLESENIADAEFTGFGQAIVFRGETYQNVTRRTLGRIVHQINDDSINTTRGTSISFETTDNPVSTNAPTVKWKIDHAGHLVAGADNTYDIGASGATRPRTLYLGTSAIIGNNPGGTGALRVAGNVDITDVGYPGFRMFVGSTQKAELVWGDPFNALYFQTFVANSTFGVSRNGTYDLYITSSGDVGLGTLTPRAKLHVQGNVSASSYTSSLNNQVGYFGTASFAVTASHALSAPGGGLSGGTTNFIPLWTGTGTLSSSVMFQSSSNIGVNTASPSAPFHVFAGASSNTLPTNAQGIFEFSANGGIAVSTPAANAAGIYFPRSTDAYYAGIERDVTTLQIRNNGATRIAISSSGNVGIGTTTPSSSLMLNASTGITHGLTMGRTGWGSLFRLGAVSSSGDDFWITSNWNPSTNAQDTVEQGLLTLGPKNELRVVVAGSRILTVNSNAVLFGTDNQFDIGGSGANRPRDVYIARNTVMGGTLTMNSTVAMQDNQITRPRFTDYAETYTTPTISGNALTLNIENGNVFRTTLNANINTGSFTISNPSSTGNACSFTLIFDANGTGYAVNWPTAVKWPGGTAPTLTTTNGRSDMFVFYTNNAGTTWYAMTAGQNFVTT